jgi:EAL domain-containing protein (putative c-di-GMP-specific phosphodiesterase class I)
MERGEFFLCYQPKVAMTSAEVLGVEALIRWQRESEGPVPPEEFIPLAEETKLINPLTLWVLKSALEELVRWQAGGVNLTIAVNLSPRNLEDPELPDQVERLLAQTSVAPERLILEITESAMMSEPRRALEVLTRLHEAGVRLSVDDFGTGYSSLAYLQRLPASELKIDRTFVAAMARDRGNALIVRSTIDLAHGLGLSVVAEGIEDAETWQTLRSLGCDAGQGYYIARPRPGNEVLEWIKAAPKQARTARA